MAGIEQLPPDQRAVLQLLLKQGRSYDDLSSVLQMDADSVRDRAHMALKALGPDTDLPDDRLDEVADYLLGQQPASSRAQTREYLADSATGRAWARVVAGELRPLASDGGLPEVPADGEEVEEAFDALEARRERREDVERSSKLGGIFLLVGLGVALAVVIVLLISGGGDDGDGDEGGQAPPAQEEEAPIVGQINLLPPDGGESPLGVAQLLAANQGLDLRIVAQELEPATENRVYALWLLNDEDDAQILGFPEGQPTEEEPLLLAQTQEPLPAATITEFQSLVITDENRPEVTEEAPTSPGKIVLEGAIQLEQPPGEGGAGGEPPPPQQPGG